MDHDLGRDLNLLNGLPDRTVHQIPRGSQAYRFAGGASDEFLQRRDRWARQATQARLSEF